MVNISSPMDSSLQMLFDQMPGCWGCKDINSTFMYANKEYADLVGIGRDQHLDIMGMTDYDMPCDTTNCADLFRGQDKAVIKSEKKLKILDIHPFVDQKWKAYVFTKVPLYDQSRKVIGTIFHGTDLSSTNIFALHSLLPKTHVSHKMLGSQTSMLLSHEFNEVKLTDREAQCLFFILQGKSAKLIAEYLGISSRTVDIYFQNLKYKFKAQNKFELIDNATHAGYMNIIPNGLLSEQLSIVLREE